MLRELTQLSTSGLSTEADVIARMSERRSELKSHGFDGEGRGRAPCGRILRAMLLSRGALLYLSRRLSSRQRTIGRQALPGRATCCFPPDELPKTTRTDGALHVHETPGLWQRWRTSIGVLTKHSTPNRVSVIVHGLRSCAYT
jgi:hypothetical protein